MGDARRDAEDCASVCKLSFGAVTRGDGKVYARVLSPAALPAHSWHSRACAADGRVLPSRIVVLETGEAVLVAPILALDYSVRVELRSGDGSVSASGEFRLRQGLCKLRGQLNTLRKSAEAERIRNCDREWRPGECRITDVRILHKSDKADILRFFVTQRMRGGQTPAHSISVVDFRGTCVSEGKAIAIGEAIYDSPDYPGVSHCRVAYSIDIPSGLGDFAIWAQGDAGSERDTIECVWQGRADALREKWRQQALPAELDPAYDKWFSVHRASERELRMQRRAAANFAIKPTFSIVVPLFHTPVGFLNDMAESVLGQTYDRLELVLVNSTPEDIGLCEAVAALCERDERVRTVNLGRNLGIAENTNAGIAEATGDFVAFLDHDDIIEPDLFYWYVEGINRYPETDLLYCDEDKLEGGRHAFPFFKPDWDPVFLETNNYICHLLCMRRSLLGDLPPATTELDGAQDHHLALAAGERARNVYHVRRVLYHWRVHEQSTAGREDVKQDSVAAGKLAIDRHLARVGLSGEALVVPGPAHRFRASVAVEGTPLVSMLVYGDEADEVRRSCEELLACTAWPSLEAVPIAATGRDVPAAINDAMGRAQGKYLVLISASCRPRQGSWIAELLELAARREVGVVAPKVLLPDGCTKSLGVVNDFFSEGSPQLRDVSEEEVDVRGISSLAHQVGAAYPDCLMVRAEVLESAGGIPDDCYGMLWGIALCLSVRESGALVVVDPQTCVVSPLHPFELDEDRNGVELAWREAEHELMRRFPRRYADPDRFYNPQLEQNGNYGLPPMVKPAPGAVSFGSTESDPVAELSLCLLVAASERRILRGSLSLWGVSSEDALRHVEMSAETPEGIPLCDTWDCLGDETSTASGYPGMLVRTVSFSLSLPASVCSLAVKASYSGAGVPFAVARLSAGDVRRLRKDWDKGTLSAGEDPRYDEWFRTRHRSQARELAFQRETWAALPEKPRFSLIVPLYKTPLSFFWDMANSVLAQTYGNFELLLVNASLKDAKLAQAVNACCRMDARVRCVSLDANLGITENTNAGIRAATGDFLAFLDHDDIIEPDLLFWYAKAVSENPETDMLYCDEDKLDGGRYVFPFFKPDWDDHLLCAENYVCHMLAVRRSTVEGIGVLPGNCYDGAQDHNMSFLVGERARCVRHVPRVLYHWRMHAGSTAGKEGAAQKSYALDAQRRVVQEHLDRCAPGARAHMELSAPGYMSCERCFVDAFVPEPCPLVSIVIPSHEAPEVLRRCMDSIQALTTWPNWEAVIVENGSELPQTFELYRELEAQGNVRVVECEQPDGFNFSMLINAGAAASKGEYVLMLNNDTEVVTPNWIELMMTPMLDGKVGCVGAKLLYPGGTVQHAGVWVGRVFGPSHAEYNKFAEDPCYYESAVLPHQLSAVTGACALVRKSAFTEVGGLDEGFPVDYNDVDFCLRLRAHGYKVVMQPRARLHHYESVSRGGEGSRDASQQASLIASLGRYATRWGAYLVEGEPFHNRNFKFNDLYNRLDLE